MLNLKSKLARALLIMTPVTVLAGCGTSGKAPVNFLQLSTVVEPLTAAQGKTLEDQRKIDRTMAGACSSGVLGANQCDEHTKASAMRKQELKQ